MESPTCTLVDHPMVRSGMTILRDQATGTEEFRRVLRLLTVMVGVEALRGLETAPKTVQTPLAPCDGAAIARPVVIFPILRAGLGMADALLTLLPAAQVGHVGLYRDEETFEPVSYYFRSPPLAEAEIFVVDPMLATGHSAADSIGKIKDSGGSRIRMVSLIGAVGGVAHLAERHPDVPVFLAALDPILNDRAYIVPGLGDAGDRYFGT